MSLRELDEQMRDGSAAVLRVESRGERQQEEQAQPPFGLCSAHHVSPVDERSSDLGQMILIAIIVATAGYLGLQNRAEPTVAASAPAVAVRDVPVGTAGVREPAASPAASA